MRNTLLIAKREYLERVRTRAFRISTVLVPLAFALLFGIGSFSNKAPSDLRSLTIASNDPELAPLIADELRQMQEDRTAGDKRADSSETAQVQYKAIRLNSNEEVSQLNRQVTDKEIDGYLWVVHSLKQVGISDASFASRTRVDLGNSARLQKAITAALVRERLQQSGMTPADASQLVRPANIQTFEVKNSAVVPTNSSKSFWGAYIMSLLLYVTVMFYGVNVAQSVAAEKSSRVFEVLLASTEPGELMTGKLLGVGMAGLTQLLIWIGCILLLSASSLGAQVLQGGLDSIGITALQPALFPVYFLLGFFFYSALCAAVGAMVGNESEVQQFNLLVMMPQVVAIVLMMYILENPTSWPVVALSLFPPFTLIVMCLRTSAAAIPAWQIILSLVLMMMAILGVMWFTSRVYRVGILMYGKRPTVLELMRWLQQA